MTSTTPTVESSKPSSKPTRRSIWRDRDDYYFDRDAAYNVVTFFESEIVHIKGPKAGKPLKLERWQRKFLRRLYGWKRRDDGGRRYKTAFVFVPRKNGKSLLGAGIAIYGLLADNELGAEVVSAAVDREQARVVFDVAAKIIELNPRLQAKCKVLSKSIVVHETASKYTVLSADVENKHGGNPSTIVFDELHTQPNGGLVEVLETGTHARLQPLIVYFTTAGHDKDSVCYEYYEKAKKVLSGEGYDPSFLSVIYEASQTDDWKDPAVWKKANPNFGVSVIPVNFINAFNDAVINKRKENGFKRLHLNVWTEQLERWLPMDQWEECGENLFVPSAHDGEWCVAGLDLSSKVDLTAFVLLFRGEDNMIDVQCYFWLPENVLKRKEEEDAMPYRQWKEEGFLMTTPGDIIDYEYIRKTINKLGDRYHIHEIGYDPWRCEQLAVQLEQDGFKPIEIRQGYPQLSEPSKELEALLQSKRLRHNNNPILRWMASNVACETDAQGNIKPSKKLAKKRIDGIVALVNALNRLIVTKGRKRSKYEDEGLVVL